MATRDKYTIAPFAGVFKLRDGIYYYVVKAKKKAKAKKIK